MIKNYKIENGNLIWHEYELTLSTLRSWINKYNATDSFNINDNRSDEKEI